MEIAYKDLFRKNYLTYVPGPAGFFAKKFKESGYSEAELIDLILGVDFSLAGADEDISLEEKCEIIERAVADAHYTSWALDLIGLVISFSAGKFSSALAVSNPIPAAVFVALFLAALVIYARFRICFERNRTALLCALRHIKMVQAKLSKSS